MSKPIQETEAVFGFSVPAANFKADVAGANPENYRMFAKQGYDPPNYTSRNISNAGYATGGPFGTSTHKGRADVDFAGQIRATFQELGLRAFDAFGAVSTSTLASGVYKHIFTLLDPHVTTELPARVFAGKFGEPALAASDVYNYRYLGMTMESLGFVMPHSADTPTLMLDCAWRGSGIRKKPSAVQFFGAGKHVKLDNEFGENFISESSGKMSFFPQKSLGGTEVELACSFYDWGTVINNNLNTESGYSGGCAQFQTADDGETAACRGEMPTQGQTVTSEFTAKLNADVENDIDPMELMEDGTEFSNQIEFTGSAIDGTYDHSAKFILNRAVAQNVTYPMVDGVRGIRVETEPLAIGNTMPFTLELITNVADFGTFVGA